MLSTGTRSVDRRRRHEPTAVSAWVLPAGRSVPAPATTDDAVRGTALHGTHARVSRWYVPAVPASHPIWSDAVPSAAAAAATAHTAASATTAAYTAAAAATTTTATNYGAPATATAATTAAGSGHVPGASTAGNVVRAACAGEESLLLLVAPYPADRNQCAQRPAYNPILSGAPRPASQAVVDIPLLSIRVVPVYIGRIPNDIDDALMRQLLDQCGRVTKWGRVQDPSTGQPVGFGFCQFLTPSGAIRALKLLDGLRLHSADEEGTGLVVKIDKSAHAVCDEFLADFAKSTINGMEQRYARCHYALVVR